MAAATVMVATPIICRCGAGFGFAGRLRRGIGAENSQNGGDETGEAFVGVFTE
jgi:hypothetical protein